MKKSTENWLEIAEYDLKVASYNFKGEYYVKVIENCHSSLEKLLKALISENKNIQPPKIHDLLRLVTISLVDNLDADITNLLDELNDLYISTRYPEDFGRLSEMLNKEKVEIILNKTKEIFKWLKKKIT